MRTSNVRSTTVLAALLLCTTIPAVADEVDLDKKQTFDIGPQSLESALLEFSEQADVQILMAANDIQGHRTEGVQGQSSPREALDVLLQDTELGYSAIGSTISVTAKDSEAEDPGNARTTPTPVMMAQASVKESSRNQEETEGEEKKKGLPIEEIVVTGTNIRGIAPESSPVRTFTREDIQISGAATAQDFIQTLTANFGGGSNADLGIGSPNNIDAQFNHGSLGSMGSSVNLRGLGSGSTLVLLNGHRLAPSSGIGDFVDISMIPAVAIERVEILTDGASSIYGADAVAGVVNFILRNDLDGAEVSFRYGTVTEGDRDEYRASLTGGKSWDTGNALLIYEYFDQGNLSVEDRIFSKGALLPNDLLPSQKRHSVLASANQELTPDLKLFADFFLSTREAERVQTNRSGSFQLSPIAENSNIAAGGSLNIIDDWIVDISGLYSESDIETEETGFSEVMRKIDSSLWTADAKASGSLFHLPGGTVKLAIGGQYRKEDFVNFNVNTNTTERTAERNIYSVFGEALIPIFGPQNSVAGVKRLEINVSGRFDDYSDVGSTANPKVGLLWSPIESLKIRGTYSTSFKPPPLGRIGASDLLVSLLPTSVTNGLFGLIPADPSIADVVAMTILGTDANLRPELSRTYTAGIDFREEWNRNEFAFTASWFNIEFKDRLGNTPVPGGRNVFDAPNIAFNDPDLFPPGTIIFSPSQGEVDTLVNNADLLFLNGFDPLDVQIINKVLLVRNLARTRVTGVDFDAIYTYESDIGSLSLGLEGTFLADFQQQAATTTPLVELVDTLYNPVKLKLRGRVAYAKKGFSANLFTNFMNSYHVSDTIGAEPIDSWTTIDLSVAYDTKEVFESSILDNTTFRISVSNILDDDPPAAPSNLDFQIFGYDPTNASALGRFIAIELTTKL